MPASHVVLLVLAGVGAGVFNGVAGGGSLISFPVLLGLGYPALTANITNTIGIWPGYVASAAGFRREIGDQSATLAHLAPVGLAGGIARRRAAADHVGGNLRPRWCPGSCSAHRPLRRRSRCCGARPRQGLDPPPPRPVLLAVGVFAASVYGGYFGAAMGVMFLAVIGLALPISLAHTSGLRAVLSMIVNGVAALVFLVHGGLAWEAVGCWPSGSLLGGYAGARLALSLPAAVLRVAVVLIGVGTAVRLLV